MWCLGGGVSRSPGRSVGGSGGGLALVRIRDRLVAGGSAGWWWACFAVTLCRFRPRYAGNHGAAVVSLLKASPFVAPPPGGDTYLQADGPTLTAIVSLATWQDQPAAQALLEDQAEARHSLARGIVYIRRRAQSVQVLVRPAVDAPYEGHVQTMTPAALIAALPKLCQIPGGAAVEIKACG